MNVWDAEHEVDEAGARALLASQFPDLALDAVVHLAAGFDNTVSVVDGTWAVRFPRREVAVPLIERELALLPGLAPRLPLPIPVPELVGHAAGDYPWPFWGGRLLLGIELADARLPEEGRAPLAEQVGGFLRALHDPSVASDLGAPLPCDPMNRGTPSKRGPMARDVLDRMAARGSWEIGSATDRAVDDLIAAGDPLAPPSGEPVVVHSGRRCSTPTASRWTRNASCGPGCWRCRCARRWPTTPTSTATRPCWPSRSPASAARWAEAGHGRDGTPSGGLRRARRSRAATGAFRRDPVVGSRRLPRRGAHESRHSILFGVTRVRVEAAASREGKEPG